MILLDAIYINNSGGKVLLDYLVRSFEERKADIFYLLDHRCSQDYKEVPRSRKMYMQGSLSARRRFYMENRTRFSDVLCFGNIPPPVNLDAFVMTYLHQQLFLEQPQNLPFFKTLKYRLKSYLIRSFKRNTDYWAVQSDNIARLVHSNWNISREKIKVLPFYPPLHKGEDVKRSENIYLFVSDGNTHKNHFRLIEAFSAFNAHCPEASLHLTVSGKYKALLEFIALKQQQGTRIVNHGLLPRYMLAGIYRSAGFAVYPSLTESFGLGIAEAVNMGCKLLAADLPYVYAVCRPTLVFDPFDTADILKALLRSRSVQLKPSVLTVSDQINHILSLYHL